MHFIKRKKNWILKAISNNFHNIEIVIIYSKNENEYSSSYGEKSGFGKYIWPQGEEYEGGKLKREYTGDWIDDKRHGRSYRGDWVNDKSHGYH